MAEGSLEVGDIPTPNWPPALQMANGVCSRYAQSLLSRVPWFVCGAAVGICSEHAAATQTDHDQPIHRAGRSAGDA